MALVTLALEDLKPMLKIRSSLMNIYLRKIFKLLNLLRIQWVEYFHHVHPHDRSNHMIALEKSF